MALWTLIVKILLWPGEQVLRLFPRLGNEESRLLHNMINYIVWLGLFCGLLIWALIKTMPPA